MAGHGVEQGTEGAHPPEYVTASREHQHSRGAGAVCARVQNSRLADSRLAFDHEDLSRPGQGAFHEPANQIELFCSAYQHLTGHAGMLALSLIGDRTAS